ncbi:MAG: sugar phosphate nucleotidyltransferase [Chthoniobacter sp.]
MNILILAAGYATRLYPLTQNKAKPLLEVAGKPMMEWVIDNLAPIKGIEKVYVVTNSKFAADFQAWADHYNQTHAKLPFEIINDGSTSDADKLGAIGDINLVISRAGLAASDLIVVAGDNLFNQSLEDFGTFLRVEAAAGARALRRRRPDRGEEVRRRGGECQRRDQQLRGEAGRTEEHLDRHRAVLLPGEGRVRICHLPRRGQQSGPARPVRAMALPADTGADVDGAGHVVRRGQQGDAGRGESHFCAVFQLRVLAKRKKGAFSVENAYVAHADSAAARSRVSSARARKGDPRSDACVPLFFPAFSCHY